MSLSFRPIGERVLIKNIENEKKTASGIILSNTVEDVEFNSKMGEIVAFGKGDDVDELIDNGVKVGDKVYYAEGVHYKIKENGDTYSIVYACDIIAKID